MSEEGKLHFMRLDRNSGATLVVKVEGGEKVFERFENGEGVGEVAKKLRRLADRLDHPDWRKIYKCPLCSSEEEIASVAKEEKGRAFWDAYDRHVADWG